MSHLRAVIVLDIDVDKLNDAADFCMYMKTVANQIESPLDGVKITQRIAGVPLKERRGKSGSIDEIVFRGTRGKYNKNKKTY
jgi:hypothetical protein